jgi:hypothetical protein
LWGVYTHWAGNHSEPCYDNKKQCPGHKRGLPLRWKGYVHVFNQVTRNEEFLEFTPTSAKQLLDQFGESNPLRGNRVQMVRGRGDKARLTLTALTAATVTNPGIILPEPKDPYETLCKLWGITDLVLNEQGRSVIPLNGTEG